MISDLDSAAGEPNEDWGPEKIAKALFFTSFISPFQSAVISQMLKGEEGAHFAAKMDEYSDRIAKMPSTYETDGQGDEAIAYLHYFSPAGDWWITEKDRGGPDDTIEQSQTQAFGMASLYGCDPELGYINIRELVMNGVELDLYWEPKPLKLCRSQK